jgi:diguanylate cyclase (GGDEF)-like protein/PAS domain S-box-containing protein
MRSILAKFDLQLSSKLYLANFLISFSFLLIAGFTILSFIDVGSKSSGVARNDIGDVIHNSRMARDLSSVFSDIDLLDRTFYRNTDFLDSEGKRLKGMIENARTATSDRKLVESLTSFAIQLDHFLSHCAVVNAVLHAREMIDQETHTELTRLDELISEWLIESTLEGENTDYVMQQLILVNGYRESLLNIAKLYAELNFNMSKEPFSRGISSTIEAIDDLAVRLQTITASTTEVALHGKHLQDNILKYKAIVERLFKVIEHLQLLRIKLKASRTSSLSAIEAIDKRITAASQTTASRIEEIVDWAGTIVVLATLGIIVLIFFTTRHLIKFNVQKPLQEILVVIDSFSRGELGNKIELGRKDEWDIIERSLNSMAAEMDQSRKALQTSYDELDQKVEERTRELADTVKALSISESSLVEAQRIAHLGHWSWDIQTGSSVWSEEQYRIFGIEPFELEMNYELFVSFLHPDDSRRILGAVSEAVKLHKGFTEQYRIVRRDGSIRWIEAQGQVRRSNDGEPIEMSGTVLDITERKRIEHLLLEEKERALVTLHSIGDAVISTDAVGRVEYLNPVAEKMTGYSVDEARDQSLEQIFHIINEETRERPANPATRCLKEGKIVGLANHTVLVSKSGVEYSIQDSAAPIKSPEGEILGVVLVFSDVTESRRLSLQISYQANHDVLTGLINRREFEHRLKRVMKTARNESTDNALCYLDLDQFKLVNDTCGHVAGDELLRQVSKLLQDNVRHRDTLARLGGDEFGLLMEHCSLKEARQVASKLVKAVSDYKFLWEKQLFKIGVSIGLITVNESSADINALLSAADAACFMAKDRGRNRIHVYQENDEELTKRHGEMQWAVRLPRALEEDCFKLYVQSIVPVASNNREGSHYEVLLRMEEDHIVLPEAFLPAADRYNLSGKLDRWVITNTFQWIVDHPAHLKRLYLCAINLSGHSLNEETFLEFILQKFREFQIPPEKICFEITETVAITNLSLTANFIEVLKVQGCRFSLDDFGSGLSSFAYLKNLPVNFLKIDGVFVKDILDDPLNLAMVKSINEIGHIMGKQTIAEFVENKAILEKLREIGVDYVQGYEIGRPRPIEDT